MSEIEKATAIISMAVYVVGAALTEDPYFSALFCFIAVVNAAALIWNALK